MAAPTSDVLAPEPFRPRAGPPVPLARLRSLAPLLEFRRRMGLPALPARLDGDEGTIPLVIGGRIWEDAAVATGDPGVAFAVGAASRVEDLPLGQHVRGSATLGDALVGAARSSSRYCTGQRMRLRTQGDAVLVERWFPALIRRGRREANDFALLMLIDLVRRAAGPGWRPAELHLEGPPPAHAERLAALATGPAHFGAPADALAVPRSLLELPLPPVSAAPPPPAGLPADDFERSVRSAIRLLLAFGEPTLPKLAELAGTSTRSLQRELAASGRSFVRRLEEARFEEASRLLRQPGLRIIDVSVELGYTDPANFTRAFRRWTGASPLAFRRSASRPGELAEDDRPAGIR